MHNEVRPGGGRELDRGSLTVVGIGIRLGVQLTPEARLAVETADLVLHLAADPLAASLLTSLNPKSVSLQRHYRPGDARHVIYERIADEIVSAVQAGDDVCAAFYGHPGVFVNPSHDAIRRVRAAGRPARMLPAVSAEDCLFADLGVDPAAGCQSYEATDFLLRSRRVDPTAALILWQIGVIGVTRYADQPRPEALRLVADRLRELYDPRHRVTLYEASPFPVGDAVVTELALAELAAAAPAPMATLYVPPANVRPADGTIVAALGLGDRD